MGSLNTKLSPGPSATRKFTMALLRDLKALEWMIENDKIESDTYRLGAEQELCLIDKNFRPAPIADQVLRELNRDEYTNELSLFNLEINLPPYPFEGRCLRDIEKLLLNLLKDLQKGLNVFQANYILSGILPTIQRHHLELEYMTPRDRYYALNEGLTKLRGRPYEFRIQGVDELITQHKNVMFESCNTSFQIHYQVSAQNFTKSYNWAQLISGPVLAAATNSPFFMGKRLWAETRIALFQQATDPRTNYEHLRERSARVFLGESWIHDGVTDIYKDGISNQRPIVIAKVEDDPLEVLKNGKVPKLEALSLHNGTIYKWNRACYGVLDGKAHLRIENRYLPSGPSVKDEVANAAFWGGLMRGMPKEAEKLPDILDFDTVKSNFISAARYGLNTRFKWMDDKMYDANKLILEKLLPIAEKGLKNAEIDQDDISTYLNIIEKRVTSSQTGAHWMVEAYDKLKKSESNDTIMWTITKEMVAKQEKNAPVHSWGFGKVANLRKGMDSIRTVGQIMTTKLYTVNEEDLVDLGPNIMKWQKIRHVLVENEEGELVGLLTMGRLAKYYSEKEVLQEQAVPIKEIMNKDVMTINAKALTLDAIEIMEKNQIGSLPVIDDNNKLVGIVTERDILRIAKRLILTIEPKNN